MDKQSNILPEISKAERDNFEKEKYAEYSRLLTEYIRDSKKIVFFGGAGVSTESGIPDFRSSDGLYNKQIGEYLSPETLISSSFFHAHTREFYEFYRDHLIFENAKPNAAHLKLAELEAAGKDVTVVTQNIDGLHQLAGSTKVYELHGSVLRNYCMKCRRSVPLEMVTDRSKPIPICPDCGGTIKPDVVLYEEQLDPDVIEGAVTAISEADLLIVAGTSLIVYPAAGFIRYFRGRHSVMINLSKTNADSGCDLVFHKKVGEVMSGIDVSNCI